MSDYVIAKYLRISSEDADLKEANKLESNSIANQRNLLEAHINRIPEFSEARMIEFCDDGWSGKNFERPAVQKMLAQVRQGKIQCIIVKDLSRFGRDYLEVGNYISRIFPFMGVRFIAVNDGLDSIHPMDVDSLDTSFKALLYDLYSRDLSRKVRSAQNFHARRGDFIAPFAPYGYVKDPANHHRLVIDPPAAETVRLIFRMMAEGHSVVQIAKALNDSAVLTPMRYKRAAGCSRTVWPCIQEDNFWGVRTLTNILRDKRYIGKNIYGKRVRDMVGSVHTVKVKRADWIVVDDTHEGIVTQEEFDRAQAAMRAFSERDGMQSRGWVLCGKVRCGTCGHAMCRISKKNAAYFCQTPRLTSAYPCSEKQIPEDDILAVILDSLHTQAVTAVGMSHIWEEQHQREKKDAAAMLKTLSILKNKLEQQKQQINSLYEMFALGESTKAEYLAAKAAAVRQKDKTAARIAELEAAIENTDKDGTLKNRFVSNFEKYTQVKELTREIVMDVLKEVRVYPEGRLEIIWNYQEDFEKMMLELG